MNGMSLKKDNGNPVKFGDPTSTTIIERLFGLSNKCVRTYANLKHIEQSQHLIESKIKGGILQEADERVKNGNYKEGQPYSIYEAIEMLDEILDRIEDASQVQAKVAEEISELI